ncbi:MAG: SIR2 family protein [Gaiellaceae bacterium]
MRIYDFLTDRDEAVRYLAGSLKEGTLAVFLGAGVSAGAGLPEWPKLVERLSTRAGLLNPLPQSASANDLQARVDLVENTIGNHDEYVEAVCQCLYEGVHLSDGQLMDPLLIALGAMMMGSRRGSVRRVVTLNLDSLLEWYLMLCGLVPRVVKEPPTLEGAEDVRIYHPHGFLPHPDMTGYSRSKTLILGLDAVFERLGSTKNAWLELLRHLLRTSVCLFVGISFRSFRDPALAPIIQEIGNEVERLRPVGFCTLCDKEDATQENIGEILRRGVVPLTMEKDDVAGFLLKICQTAGREISV